MNTKTIDGAAYARMLSSGAAMLCAHESELNDLNVFPVADGDTGTNMKKTMEGGLSSLSDNVGIGAISRDFSRGTLLGARGNSGVILSQIFAGINERLSTCDEADARELSLAFASGIKKSYAAVQNPTEGTILTVFREATEYASAAITADSTVEDFLRLHIEEARRSLAKTKERLSVLAEADVVDSGAAGYLYIAEGMYEALCGKPLAYAPAEAAGQDASLPNLDRFTRDSVLEFGYCTEFLLRLTTAKVDPDSFPLSRVTEALSALGGESVVAYKQEDIIKVHVHTKAPGEVLTRMQEFGEFLTLKIENMSLGHSEDKSEKKKAAPRKKFATVALATGDGLSALFTDMGADVILSGGQSANPSIEELTQAFREANAEHILVLPNNKNVILAARQAAKLCTDATVHVLETASLMQGYAALSVITPGITDIGALIASAERAAKSVTDGEVTRAVRDATVNGRVIRCGDYMAFCGGELVSVAQTAEEAVLSLLAGADTDLSEIITLIAGRGVDAEARAALTEQIADLYPDLELTVYEGGQDVYDYLIAIE